MVFLTLRIFSRFRARALKNQFPAKKEGQRPMKGLIPYKYPVTNTTTYLNEGIEFRECVQCVAIHYSEYFKGETKNLNSKQKLENLDLEREAQILDWKRSAAHKSVRRLVELNFNQLQYKNPDVQIVVIKNQLPTAFLTFFLNDGKRFHIDATGKDHINLLRYIQQIIGKPRELIEMETRAVELNPANFGKGFLRQKLTDVEGQLPASEKFGEFSEEAVKMLVGKHHDINKHWKSPEEMDD